jgi:hypothetical protein
MVTGLFDDVKVIIFLDSSKRFVVKCNKTTEGRANVGTPHFSNVMQADIRREAAIFKCRASRIQKNLFLC